MSLFFVDNGSELTFEQIKSLGIECFNFRYTLNDKVLDFDDKFDYDKFYSKFKKGVCVGLYNYSAQDYVDIFEPCLQQDDIIYICGSQDVAFNENLYKARDILTEKYSDRSFKIIESKNFSIGQGIVSYLLALGYKKGDNLEEIENKSFEIRDEIATYFMVDNVEQLYLNNLLPSNSVAGTSLNIKPILTIDIDGKFQVIDKVSGKRKALSTLITYIRQIGKNVADYPIGIVYTDNENMAIELKDEILSLFGEEVKIIMSRMSPVNSAILGRGALGLSFHVHKKVH